MNKKLFFSAMVVCFLSFGLIVVSCGGDSSKLTGLWEFVDGDDFAMTYKFKGNNFTLKQRNGEVLFENKGTYSLKDDTIELLHDDGETGSMSISKDRKTITLRSGIRLIRK
jgi:hypothetical protein